MKLIQLVGQINNKQCEDKKREEDKQCKNVD
jgi:hypothetical protein